MQQVREYATLTTDTRATRSLDCGVVSEATMDWLVDLGNRSNSKEPVLWLDQRRIVKLGSHVGYLRSPTGEAIEILPKTGLGQENPERARRVLQSMLQSALSLPAREIGAAELLRMNTPIHEWIFSQFLQQLSNLMSRGLRFHYEDVEDEGRYLLGQLQLARQLRQPPGKSHLFHIKHALFTPNRIENRLLKTALEYVRLQANTTENWRLANELSHRLEEIPAILNPLMALPHWQDSKLMQPYQAVHPWCQLILEQLNPNFQKGLHEGIALLLPMDKLFEKHVEACLRCSLPVGAQLIGQAASRYLLTHQPADKPQAERWFQLKPDLLLRSGSYFQVLDTKWKLLDQLANTSEHKYKISQSDLYQLYAYGEAYLGGSGDMMLIYPKHTGFDSPLPVFTFGDSLRLWAVPFCLETESLVPGEWVQFFPLGRVDAQVLRI